MLLVSKGLRYSSSSVNSKSIQKYFANWKKLRNWCFETLSYNWTFKINDLKMMKNFALRTICKNNKEYLIP